MGFERIVPKPPRPHKCPTPWMMVTLLQGLGVGSQWRCDECRQLWVLCGDGPQNPTKWEECPDTWGQPVAPPVVGRCPLCGEPNGGTSHRQGGVWRCAGSALTGPIDYPVQAEATQGLVTPDLECIQPDAEQRDAYGFGEGGTNG